MRERLRRLLAEKHNCKPEEIKLAIYDDEMRYTAPMEPAEYIKIKIGQVESVSIPMRCPLCESTNLEPDDSRRLCCGDCGWK